MPSFPFDRKSQWLLASRHKHTIAAVRPFLADLPPPTARIVGNRLHALQFWIKVRLAVLVLLYMSLIVTLLGILAGYVAQLAVTAQVAARVAGFTGGAMGTLLAALVLFLTRLLNKLDTDVVLLLTLNNLEEADILSGE